MAALTPDTSSPATPAQGWGSLSQQILNHFARAAERRALLSLDRRDLDACGLTPADVAPGLPDLYANDFRVAQIALRRAA